MGPRAGFRTSQSFGNAPNASLAAVDISGLEANYFSTLLGLSHFPALLQTGPR